MKVNFHIIDSRVLFRNANFLPQRKSKMLSILKMSRINPLLGQEKYLLPARTSIKLTQLEVVQSTPRSSAAHHRPLLTLTWPRLPRRLGSSDASVDNCLLICLPSPGFPAINLAEMALQPEHRQYFKERPGNLTVVEGESVTLR